MKRIFISSVIEGFEEERRVAKDAIESLDLIPVMAEDFGAKPYSPQKACIEGVKKSDVYLGVLGSRYGYVAESGLSVSEEEFNAAREKGIPILWLIMDCTREPQQEEFYKRIANYEEGYHVCFFESSTNLATKITRAIYDCVVQSGKNLLDEDKATKHSNKYLAGIESKNESETAVGAIIFPACQGKVYMEIDCLGTKEVKDKILKSTLFGSPALFDIQFGTKEVEKRENLKFEQQDESDRTYSIIEVHMDGTLAWRARLDSERNSGMFTFPLYVIDEDEVERKLVALLAFAEKYYRDILKNDLISSFYLTTIIYNPDDKKLGKIRKPSKEGFTISIGFGNSMENPLLIPRKPMKIGRAELKNTEKLAKKIMYLIVRAFKAEEMYHEPDR